MQKIGNEHLVMLPVSPAEYLEAGPNYLAVVSEGFAGTNVPPRIGTNASSFGIQSFGELTPIDLGTVGSTNLVITNSIEGGEVRAYQFTVPEGLTSLEAQLQNVTGNPAMVLRVGAQLPNPGAATSRRRESARLSRTIMATWAVTRSPPLLVTPIPTSSPW
jgi:hypothetical protein